ncbi:unnamed protein product [Amoebophrya sp. A120]|nr:unnamed protein product [Amoebophrya sp. A120]|eukprot:GSA120T00023980001.1
MTLRSSLRRLPMPPRGITLATVTVIIFLHPLTTSVTATPGKLTKTYRDIAEGFSAAEVKSWMQAREYGTCAHKIPQAALRWGCSEEVANRICCQNRHYAEYAGYWQSTMFLEDVAEEVAKGEPVDFYDPEDPTKLLFRAPIGRTWGDFLKESEQHGWPSFRDAEVVSEYVRVLPDSGEVVTPYGTHLGHNLPDRKGNRYCINLVCVAGQPEKDAEKKRATMKSAAALKGTAGGAISKEELYQ